MKLCLLLVMGIVYPSVDLGAQTARLDSLKKALPGAAPDTSYINTLISLGNSWRDVSTDSAMHYHQLAERKAAAINDALHRAEALHEIGWNYYLMSDIERAEKKCSQALQLCEQTFRKERDTKIRNRIVFLKMTIYKTLGSVVLRNGEYDQARNYFSRAVKAGNDLKNFEVVSAANNDIAKSYYMQGIYYKALDYCLEGLKACEKTGNERSIASNLGNIGIIFKEQGDYNKALEYFERALRIDQKIKNRRAEGIVQGNIGVIYQQMKEKEKALDCFFKAIEINKEINETQSMVYNYNNVGILYNTMERYQEALEYFEKSLELVDKNDLFTLMFTYNSVASVYVNMKKFREAEDYSDRAEKIGKQIKALNLLTEVYKIKSDLYSAMGNPGKAFGYYKKYVQGRDSLNNEEKTRQSIQMEANFSYQKKVSADSVAFAREKEVRDAELAKKEAEIRADRNQRYALYGGLALMLLFAGFIFNRFRVTQRQNSIIKRQKKEVENQKILVESKQKEIIDSITYAKRIQTALLPSMRVISDHFPENFVLYMPKDIVAGDFYWFVPGAETANRSTLVAAVDCTGHGVPGAMVSVIANNSLNRAVKEFGLTDPAAILNKTRDLVVEEFGKSDEDVRDGMDISLVSLEMANSAILLRWSGANNPLWILRKDQPEIEEWKPQKQSIGKGEAPKPFTGRETVLQKGDTIYLFTDGYADQFGGKDGKKFKYSQLKQLFVDNARLELKTLNEKLQTVFREWKGSLDQIDDVCIIGIRV